MAKHIVVSFDDDDDAAQFMAAIKIEGAIFFQDPEQHFKHIDVNKARVIGVFAKPTKFCECPYVADMPTARSAKYGWYIHHPGCSKPIPGHYQSGMKNLLDPENIDSRARRVFLGVREGELRYPEPTTTKREGK